MNFEKRSICAYILFTFSESSKNKTSKAFSFQYKLILSSNNIIII